jgi:hypothetical protein
MVRTNFFDFARFSRFWKLKSSLEVFKFSMYISIPIGASIFYANPEFMHVVIRKLNFIEYPEADPRPQTADELEAVRMLNKSKRSSASASASASTSAGGK